MLNVVENFEMFKDQCIHFSINSGAHHKCNVCALIGWKPYSSSCKKETCPRLVREAKGE